MREFKIAAVRYLNMLPYFFDDPAVELFETPALLNSALRSGAVDAACTSAIAGLKAGFKTLEPMLGVGAPDKVGSVFLEPLLLTSQHQIFWKDFWLSGGARDNPHVAILTSGASEQSLWLSQLLLSWKGCRTSVHRIAKHNAYVFDKESAFEHLAQTEAEQALYLCIGDVALYRALAGVCINSPLLRWDIAELWHQAQKLPCVFAAWFVKSELSHEDMQSLYELCLSSVVRWRAQTPESRLRYTVEFLRQKNDPLLQLLPDERTAASLEEYFGQLEFIFSKPYASAYRQYVKFNSVFF